MQGWGQATGDRCKGRQQGSGTGMGGQRFWGAVWQEGSRRSSYGGGQVASGAVRVGKGWESGPLLLTTAFPTTTVWGAVEFKTTFY